MYTLSRLSYVVFKLGNVDIGETHLHKVFIVQETMTEILHLFLQSWLFIISLFWYRQSTALMLWQTSKTIVEKCK